MEILARRSNSKPPQSNAVGQSPKLLLWREPERATQRAENAPYEVRGSRVREGKEAGTLMYWAWLLEPKPKLLGYFPEPEAARQCCQAHYLTSP